MANGLGIKINTSFETVKTTELIDTNVKTSTDTSGLNNFKYQQNIGKSNLLQQNSSNIYGNTEVETIDLSPSNKSNLLIKGNSNITTNQISETTIQNVSGLNQSGSGKLNISKTNTSITSNQAIDSTTAQSIPGLNQGNGSEIGGMNQKRTGISNNQADSTNQSISGVNQGSNNLNGGMSQGNSEKPVFQKEWKSVKSESNNESVNINTTNKSNGEQENITQYKYTAGEDIDKIKETMGNETKVEVNNLFITPDQLFEQKQIKTMGISEQKIKEYDKYVGYLENVVEKLKIEKKNFTSNNYIEAPFNNIDKNKMAYNVSTEEKLKKYEEDISATEAMILEYKRQKELYKEEAIINSDKFKEIYDEKTKIELFNEKYEEYTDYLNDKQKEILTFYYKVGGEARVKEYLNALEDQINKCKGAEEANQFLKSLENDPNAAEKIGNFFNTLKEGSIDGIITFGEGIKNSVYSGDPINSKIYEANTIENQSVNEYKQMFILSVLNENEEWKQYLPITYQFGNTLGNMVPTMIASAAVTAATGGAGAPTAVANIAGRIAGAGSIFASSMGNSTHSALVKGESIEKAQLYGFVNGLSEAGLEYALGTIPGIGKESSNMLTSMLKEGTEESIQEIASELAGAAILGENIDLEILSENTAESFVMGALMSGVMSGSTTAMSKLYYKGKNVILDSIETKKLEQQIAIKDYEGAKATIVESVNEKSRLSNTADFSTTPRDSNKIKDSFYEKIRVTKLAKEVELTQQEKQFVNTINYRLSTEANPVIEVSNTKELSSNILRNIIDIDRINFRIYGGFLDINGNFKMKYNKQKYMNRITYNGRELVSIISKIEELQSKVNMNLRVKERSRQIYELIASEIPPMFDYNKLENGYLVSQSLRGIVQNNYVGKSGLICAGYSQIFKELCERCQIKCEYIRGNAWSDPLRKGVNGGGHAWNVVIDGDSIIPVDVTWKACSNKNWFGQSEEFTNTREADTDELFKEYMPKQTITDVINDVIKTINQKYNNRGIDYLSEYMNTNNITYITSTNNSRQKIASMPMQEINKYLYKVSTICEMIKEMDQKYSYGHGEMYLKKFAETGDYSYITSNNNLRERFKEIDSSLIDFYIESYLRRR